jgi:microsomal dipeptidase-like Zn-dependent dipeptidase
MVGTDAYCTTSTTSGGITGSLAMTAQSQLSPHANPRAVEAVNRVKEHHEEAILNLEGVVGIGVGLSETVPEDVVIEVYVKKPAHEMKHVIPEMLEDVPVKIVETGEIVAF